MKFSFGAVVASDLWFILPHFLSLKLCRKDLGFSQLVSFALLFQGEEKWLDLADCGCYGLGHAFMISHDWGANWTSLSSKLGNRRNMPTLLNPLLKWDWNGIKMSVYRVNIVYWRWYFWIFYLNDTGNSLSLSRPRMHHQYFISRWLLLVDSWLIERNPIVLLAVEAMEPAIKISWVIACVWFDNPSIWILSDLHSIIIGVVILDCWVLEQNLAIRCN